MDYLRAYAESDDENCTESRRIAGGASCETLSALKRKRINDESNDQSTLHKTRRTRRETACATRYLDIEAAIGEGSEGESDEGEGDEDAGFVDDSLAGFDLTDPRSVAWEEEEDVVREAEELIRIEAEKLIQRAQRDDGRGRHASETRTARERECENERMRRGQRKEVRARQERESERARRVHGGPPRRAAGRIGNAEETLEEQVEEYFLTIAERDHSKFRKRFEWGRLRRAIGRARSRQLVLVESARSVLMIVPDGPKGGRLERFHIKLGHRLEDVLHPEDEPTREEIALWDGVDKLIPQAASNPRAGMALGPGCRVSFKSLDTEERDKNGFITEMKEDNRVARVRISVDGETILQSDPRLYELLTFPTAKAATNKIEEIEVPVVDLRRHLLCVPCHLRHFDRVRVVGSRASAVGVRGRVCAIESSGDDPQVTLVTEEGKDIEVAMSEVIREFMLGDLVDVVAGPVAGERGIIVDMLLGGGLQLFATSSAAVNRSVQVLDSLLSDYEALADLKLDVDTDGKVANTLGLLHVVAEQVEFAQADCRPGGWSLPSTTKPAHQARALSEYDKSRQEKTMHTGRGRYKHEEVLIISPHPMKGQWGVVLDEHDIVSATDFTKAEGDPTVVLTVRGEMSLKTWQVPLDQVVHRWYMLSLLQRGRWRN
ncbi:hypothetical protein DFH06DRAFT_583436 [Mycena polygramma]|nr:hypothetical protein DFH06DRAFT_583436 [Mycena polygramma]